MLPVVVPLTAPQVFAPGCCPPEASLFSPSGCMRSRRPTGRSHSRCPWCRAATPRTSQTPRGRPPQAHARRHLLTALSGDVGKSLKICSCLLHTCVWAGWFMCPPCLSVCQVFSASRVWAGLPRIQHDTDVGRPSLTHAHVSHHHLPQMGESPPGLNQWPMRTVVGLIPVGVLVLILQSLQ